MKNLNIKISKTYKRKLNINANLLKISKTYTRKLNINPNLLKISKTYKRKLNVNANLLRKSVKVPQQPLSAIYFENYFEEWLWKKFNFNHFIITPK